MFSIDNTASTDTQIYGKLKRFWRRKRYQRLYPADYGTVNSYDDEVLLASRKKRYSNVARFGSVGTGDNHQNKKNMGQMRRKMGVSPKMRLKRFLVTPVIRILGRIRNGYINMMLGIGGGDAGNDVFGGKRIPKARQVEEKKNKKVSNSDLGNFETKLVYEIYKVLAASRQYSVTEAAKQQHVVL